MQMCIVCQNPIAFYIDVFTSCNITIHLRLLPTKFPIFCFEPHETLEIKKVNYNHTNVTNPTDDSEY